MNSSIHIYLNTKDRVSGTNTNGTFILSQSELSSHKYGISLESAVIPNLEYPVNRSNNNIYFKENGGATLVATIPQGVYNASELSAELKSALEAVGALTYTIIYVDTTKKYSFNVGIGNTIQFVSGQNSINNVIGFPETGSDVLSSITSQYPVRLDGIEYCDLQLGGVPSNTNISSSQPNTSTIARVPILEQFSGVVYYVNPDNHSFLTIQHDLLYRIRYRLVAPSGRDLILPSNVDVSLVLRCETV